MTVVGVTMVRDEADVIETVLRHMATQVDALIVANNLSADGTSDILFDLQLEWQGRFPLVVAFDNEVGYEQSKKMTSLARCAAHDFGADWVVPFDADEIWYSPFRRIGDFLESRPADEMIMPAVLYDHVATGEDDPSVDDPVLRIKWRRAYPAALPKVACRWRDDLVIEMGNHAATYSEPVVTSEHRLAIRHFPYRSAEQVIRKIRNGAEAYAATDLPEHFGAHWRGWGRILDQHGPEAIEELFLKWHWREDPTRPLDIDGDVQPPLRLDPVSDLTTASVLGERRD